MKDKKLVSHLQELGLSDNESRVYLGLLRYGHLTVMELSNRIRMNRSTVHVCVNSLIAKGLVSQAKYGERRMLIPESPEKLSLLIENERMRLKRKEEALPSLIGNIYDIISNAKESTQSVVKYIEGRNSIEKLYDAILESKEVRSYFNFQLQKDYFPDNGDKFYNAAKRNGIKVWDILTSENRQDSIINHKIYKDTDSIKYKFLPGNIKLRFMDYLIYDNKIAMIYIEELPKAIIISNSLLFENTKILFDLMWSML